MTEYGLGFLTRHHNGQPIGLPRPDHLSLNIHLGERIVDAFSSEGAAEVAAAQLPLPKKLSKSNMHCLRRLED
jgi:hypothetical protein